MLAVTAGPEGWTVVVFRPTTQIRDSPRQPSVSNILLLCRQLPDYRYHHAPLTQVKDQVQYGHAAGDFDDLAS